MGHITTVNLGVPPCKAIKWAPLLLPSCGPPMGKNQMPYVTPAFLRSSNEKEPNGLHILTMAESQNRDELNGLNDPCHLGDLQVRRKQMGCIVAVVLGSTSDVKSSMLPNPCGLRVPKWGGIKRAT